MNIQDWLPWELTGLTSLWSKGLSRVLQYHNSKASILQHSVFFMVQLTSVHNYWKNHSCDYNDLYKVVSQLFNMLSRFVMAFLTKSKYHFNFMAAVMFHSDFKGQESKICHSFHFFPFCLPWSDGTGCHDLSFLNIEFQARFFIPLSPSLKDSLVPLHLRDF